LVIFAAVFGLGGSVRPASFEREELTSRRRPLDVRKALFCRISWIGDVFQKAERWRTNKSAERQGTEAFFKADEEIIDL